jgi:ABC-type branched-subunit amino acid transport system permease subunit
MTERLFGRHRPVLSLLAAILVAGLLAWGHPFWIDTLVMIAIFAMFALSAGISYGQAGIPSMATGTFAALGAYGSAILSTRYGLSPYLGLVIAVILPALVAYPLARAVTRLSPLPLSLATFALAGAAEISIRAGGDFTGSYVGILGIPPVPGAKSPQAMFVLSWAVVIIAAFLCTNLLASPLGRAANTARHDGLRATADGVDVSNLLAWALSFSASLAGVGGWLYAHYISYVSPESLNTYLAISALLMAVVGGAQTVIGPILGATLLTLLNTYLPAAQTQGMVYGVVLVLVLMLAPQGILGLARQRLLRRSRSAEERARTARNPGMGVPS